MTKTVVTLFYFLYYNSNCDLCYREIGQEIYAKVERQAAHSLAQLFDDETLSIQVKYDKSLLHAEVIDILKKTILPEARNLATPLRQSWGGQ